MIRFIIFCYFTLLLCSIPVSNGADYTYEIDCNNLRMGQYICPHPDYDFIDHKTQQPKGCTKENKAKGKNLYILIFYTASKILKFLYITSNVTDFNV